VAETKFKPIVGTKLAVRIAGLRLITTGCSRGGFLFGPEPKPAGGAAEFALHFLQGGYG